MKKIWQYLKQHIAEDFNITHYAIVFLFLGICMFFNFKWNFYNTFLREQTGIIKFAYYFIFYGVAFYVPVLSYALIKRKSDFYKKPSFWIKSLLVTIILAIDNSFSFRYEWVEMMVAHPLQYWVFKVLNYLLSVFTIIIPLLIFHKLYERNDRTNYGLNSNRFDLKPYLILLALVIPLIATAGFHGSFLNQYPMYKSSGAHKYLCAPEWFTATIFELAYASDFVSVEFIFRGFLVIGMMAILGRSSVLTMASVYCFLHFGKPPGEAISSIFGGYILGVIAYETRNVWGGIFIHIGVAWTMELSAHLQH